MNFLSFFRRKKSLKECPAISNFRERSSRNWIHQLEDVFKKFDANGDGKISATELGSIMRSLGHHASEHELEKMIKEVDCDGDGFIDLEEFIDLNTKGVDSDAILEDLKSAFSIFDIDQNGSISPAELQKVLKSLGENISLKECKRMINGVDCDGDGQISFEEFKVMMRINQDASSPSTPTAEVIGD